MIVASDSRPANVGRTLRKLLGGLCGALLGGALLSMVAAQDRSGTATVVVHVTEPDVVVTLGGASFSVDGVTYTPFVRDLPAGRHRLTMRRRGALIHAEEFSVKDGEEKVLTAWPSVAAADASED